MIAAQRMHCCSEHVSQLLFSSLRVLIFSAAGESPERRRGGGKRDFLPRDELIFHRIASIASSECIPSAESYLFSAPAARIFSRSFASHTSTRRPKIVSIPNAARSTFLPGFGDAAYFRFYFYSTRFGGFCCWQRVLGCECVPVARRTSQTAAEHERRRLGLGNALRFDCHCSLAPACALCPAAPRSVRLSATLAALRRSRCNVYGRDALRAAQHNSCESVVAEIACPLFRCEHRSTCMTFHSSPRRILLYNRVYRFGIGCACVRSAGRVCACWEKSITRQKRNNLHGKGK